MDVQALLLTVPTEVLRSAGRFLQTELPKSSQRRFGMTSRNDMLVLVSRDDADFKSFRAALDVFRSPGGGADAAGSIAAVAAAATILSKVSAFLDAQLADMPADGPPLVVVAVPPNAPDAEPLLAATLRLAAAAPQRAGRVVVCDLLRIKEQERASERQPPCSYDSAKAKDAAHASMSASPKLAAALAAGSGPAAVVVIDDWAHTGITMEASSCCILAAAEACRLAKPRLITAALCATKASDELGDARPEAPETLRREAEALVLRRPDVPRFVERVKSVFAEGTFGGDEADDSYMTLIVGLLSEAALRLADWSIVLPVVTPSASGIYLRVETQTLDAVEAAAATQAARGEMDVSNAAAAALARALMEAGRRGRFRSALQTRTVPVATACCCTPAR